MSEPRLEPLAEELQRLLDNADPWQAPPEGAQARVRARVAMTAANPGAPLALGRLAGEAAPGLLGGTGGVAVVALVSAAALWAGWSLVAREPAHVTPAPVVRVLVVPPPRPEPVDMVPSVPALPAPAAPPAPAVPRPVRSPPRVAAVSPARAPASTLDQERHLLDAARAHLAAGAPHAALERLQDHAQAFPQGALAEEREALWVLAWVRAGDLEQAQRHARQLRSQHPASIYLDLAERALAAGTRIPGTAPPPW